MIRRGHAGLLAISLLILGASSAGRPSPVGLTHLAVSGEARDVVLVDPLGRVDRSKPRSGERPIPDCNRWDGGTQTSLNDSLEDEPTGDPTVTEFDLTRPITGRYRLSADLVGEWTQIHVTLHGSSPALDACPNLANEIRNRRGRYVWSIDFAPVESGSKCPVQLSKPARWTR